MAQDFILDVLPLVTGHRMAAIVHLKWRDGLGSGFIANSDAGQCWITARHVIEGAAAGDTVQIFHDSQWKTLQIEEIVHSSLERDVSAFTVGFHIPFGSPILLSKLGGLLPGQTVSAWGYPHGLIQFQPTDFKHPMPLSKQGSFAGILDTTWGHVMLMDALINQGFSGGPVFAADLEQKFTFVCGLVSSIRPEIGELGTIWDISVKPHRKLDNLISRVHSGFTYIVPIAEVRDLARTLTNFPKPT